jgi:hypothetical protein
MGTVLQDSGQGSDGLSAQEVLWEWRRGEAGIYSPGMVSS